METWGSTTGARPALPVQCQRHGHHHYHFRHHRTPHGCLNTNRETIYRSGFGLLLIISARIWISKKSVETRGVHGAPLTLHKRPKERIRKAFEEINPAPITLFSINTLVLESSFEHRSRRCGLLRDRRASGRTLLWPRCLSTRQSRGRGGGRGGRVEYYKRGHGVYLRTDNTD